MRFRVEQEQGGDGSESQQASDWHKALDTRVGEGTSSFLP